jgi:hypothetical protein
MTYKVEELRQQRTVLLYESTQCQTQFLKQRLYKKIKAINIELFKETKNPIYL